MLKTWIFLFGLLFLSEAYADNQLKRHFINGFEKHYVPRKCGPNILNLLKRAKNKGLDLSQARILELTNKGFTNFGLINAEWAREAGRKNPAYPQKGFHNLAGETNWHHHVVLEKDGFIYDYDFGNTPKIIPVRAYFIKMFLKEKKKSEGGDVYIGAREKLKKYQVVIRNGLQTIRAKANNERMPKGRTLTFQEYLKINSKK